MLCTTVKRQERTSKLAAINSYVCCVVWSSKSDFCRFFRITLVTCVVDVAVSLFTSPVVILCCSLIYRCGFDSVVTK